MNPKLVLLLFCASLVTAAQAGAKTILPDACGDNNVNFDVHAESNQPAPDLPAPGKARIIFVEDQDSRGAHFSYFTVRYGVDGTWVGANYGSSYFALTVDPGLHHLCVSAQGGKHKVQVASFTAEAGKVYYFSASIAISGGSAGAMIPATMGPNGAMSGGGMVPRTKPTELFSLSQLNEDEGKYRVKAWKLATWKSKQVRTAVSRGGAPIVYNHDDAVQSTHSGIERARQVRRRFQGLRRG
jgi:hypothetical protein